MSNKTNAHKKIEKAQQAKSDLQPDVALSNARQARATGLDFALRSLGEGKNYQQYIERSETFIKYFWQIQDVDELL